MFFIIVNQNLVCFYCFCNVTKWFPGTLLDVGWKWQPIITRGSIFIEKKVRTPSLCVRWLQITSDFKCNSVYAAYRGITDRMICAGDHNGGKSAWQEEGHDKNKYLYVKNSHVQQTQYNLFCKIYGDFCNIIGPMSR